MKESPILADVLGGIFHGYLLLVAGIGLFGLFSSIDGVRIHTFAVEGNAVVPSERIIDASESVISRKLAFIVGRDIPFWAPHQSVAATVYALDPHIREVSVGGRFSRTLSIKVVEETPAMLWCGSDVPREEAKATLGCWYANERGTIYAEAPEYMISPYRKFFTTPTPIFYDPYPRAHEYPLGYVIADEITMGRLTVLADALSERGYQATALGVNADADVVVFTEEGTRFLFSLSRDIGDDMKRIEALREALKIKKESMIFKEVDLRFGAKIYYQ